MALFSSCANWARLNATSKFPRTTRDSIRPCALEPFELASKPRPREFVTLVDELIEIGRWLAVFHLVKGRREAWSRRSSGVLRRSLRVGAASWN